MAHKKGLGSSKNGRDSESKRLGVKIFDGQEIKAGMIVVRQRGTRFRPGPGTGLGRDHTIFATRDGKVAFRAGGAGRVVSVGLGLSRVLRPRAGPRQGRARRRRLAQLPAREVRAEGRPGRRRRGKRRRRRLRRRPRSARSRLLPPQVARFEATRGRHGEGSNRRGADGDDVELGVPVGTQVLDEDERLLADLAHPGARIVAAHGGRGGAGTGGLPRRPTKRPGWQSWGRPGRRRRSSCA